MPPHEGLNLVCFPLPSNSYSGVNPGATAGLPPGAQDLQTIQTALLGAWYELQLCACPHEYSRKRLTRLRVVFQGPDALQTFRRPESRHPVGPMALGLQKQEKTVSCSSHQRHKNHCFFTLPAKIDMTCVLVHVASLKELLWEVLQPKDADMRSTAG